ncbi:MAG TPA: AraC family transcriptional regulator [Pyrinomonadaceae bacterium]
MSRTLLAVGPWRECGKIVASAMANRWSVLYTLLFEDIPEALGVARVDLILLSGCSTRLGWEGFARGAWEICRDTPVVALGAGPGQDALVSALVGGAAHAAGAGTRAPEEAADEGFNCSEVSPTLKLYEPKSAAAGPGIGRALELIEGRYSEPITLDDAARAAGYSRCHFSKVFRERLGVCFVSYLGRVRLRRAAELLARTEMSVTRVALEVGFNDLSHFERAFRAAYRRSPRKFRGESKEMPHAEKYPPSFPPRAVTS